MKLKDLLHKKKMLFIDGGMGSLLAARGCDTSGVSNLENPEAVLDIHREYSEAGADILITNTFTMNRISIEFRGLDLDVEEVNQAGVSLARRAAGAEKLVFGDLGPTGKLLEPYGTYTEQQFYDNYAEQAGIFAGEEVDGLIIETFTDLREAECALKACKDKTDLPVILSMSFNTTEKGGRTIMGSSVQEAAKLAEAYGAAAVGANCGDLDPIGMAVITGIYREATSLPIIIQPNAGIPKLVGTETTYDMPPDQYARDVLRCFENGASIIGGCCGTTPAHIAALVKMLEGRF